MMTAHLRALYPRDTEDQAVLRPPTRKRTASPYERARLASGALAARVHAVGRADRLGSRTRPHTVAAPASSYTGRCADHGSLRDDLGSAGMWPKSSCREGRNLHGGNDRVSGGGQLQQVLLAGHVAPAGQRVVDDHVGGVLQRGGSQRVTQSDVEAVAQSFVSPGR